jgi:hypothetical protein
VIHYAAWELEAALHRQFDQQPPLRQQQQQQQDGQEEPRPKRSLFRARRGACASWLEADEAPATTRTPGQRSGRGGRGSAWQEAAAEQAELELSIAAPLLALAAALEGGFMPAQAAVGGGSSSGSEASESGTAMVTRAAAGGRRRSVNAELEELLAADSSVWSLARSLQAGTA